MTDLKTWCASDVYIPCIGLMMTRVDTCRPHDMRRLKRLLFFVMTISAVLFLCDLPSEALAISLRINEGMMSNNLPPRTASDSDAILADSEGDDVDGSKMVPVKDNDTAAASSSSPSSDHGPVLMPEVVSAALPTALDENQDINEGRNTSATATDAVTDLPTDLAKSPVTTKEEERLLDATAAEGGEASSATVAVDSSEKSPSGSPTPAGVVKLHADVNQAPHSTKELVSQSIGMHPSTFSLATAAGALIEDGRSLFGQGLNYGDPIKVKVNTATGGTVPRTTDAAAGPAAAPGGHWRRTRGRAEHNEMLGTYMWSGCDLFMDGPDVCAYDSESQAILSKFATRRSFVALSLFVLVAVLAIVFQTIIRWASASVYKSGDRYLRIVFETIFRQLAVINLVSSVILLILRMDVIENNLENKLFGDIRSAFPQMTGVFGDSHLELIFDDLLSMSMLFTLVYIAFVLFYIIVARDTLTWLCNIDLVSVDQMFLPNGDGAVKDGGEKPITRHTMYGAKTSEMQAIEHAALRWEFEDTVESNGVPGLDPAGYYFGEYLRSCYLNRSVGIVRVPNSTLFGVLLLAIFLYPLSRLHGKAGVICVTAFSGGALTATVVLWLWIRWIEGRVRPKDPYAYAKHRHQAATGDVPEDQDLLMRTGPAYKHRKPSTGRCFGFWLRLLYGTDFPSRHESLFFWWRRGPSVLTRMLELCYFCQMLLLSYLFFVANRNETLWWGAGWCSPIFGVLAIAVLQLLLLPSILWRLIVVTSTGEMIESSILQVVWEEQRAEIVRRSAKFIDLIRMDGMLYDIEKGGESYWSSLTASSSVVSLDVATQNRAIFAKLDTDEDGLLRPPQLYQWMLAQGVTVESIAQARAWFAVFDHDQDGGLNFSEFQVVLFVVKRLLSEPLDPNAIVNLLAGRYSILIADHILMDLRLLKCVLGKLRQNWSDSQIRHFLDYVAGQRGGNLSIVEFVERLRVLESETLGALHQAVDRLKVKPTPAPMASGERRCDGGRSYNWSDSTSTLA